MRLDLSEDEVALRDAFRAFFLAESTPERVREHAELGFDPQLWTSASELGLPAMGLSAAAGGGAELSQLAVVATEIGRTVACLPFIEHAVAGRLLERHGWPTERLAAGNEIATVALRPLRRGVAAVTPAGAVAHVVVARRGDDLVAAVSEPPQVAARNHADAPLADRPIPDDAVVLATGASAVAAYERALHEWSTLTAAALVGIAQSAIEMARQYVMQRQQFGVPIGSFQAVQHGLADSPGQILGAELLTGKACWAGDLETATGVGGVLDIDDNVVEEFGTLATMALVYSAEVAATATDRSLHFHGGYGYSEEYDIQLYYRRARGWPGVAGDPARLLRLAADRCFGPAPTRRAS